MNCYKLIGRMSGAIKAGNKFLEVRKKKVLTSDFLGAKAKKKNHDLIPKLSSSIKRCRGWIPSTIQNPGSIDPNSFRGPSISNKPRYSYLLPSIQLGIQIHSLLPGLELRPNMVEGFPFLMVL
jgi:hypothetical protein